jgi:hypothetical protein
VHRNSPHGGVWAACLRQAGFVFVLALHVLHVGHGKGVLVGIASDCVGDVVSSDGWGRERLDAG